MQTGPIAQAVKQAAKFQALAESQGIPADFPAYWMAMRKDVSVRVRVRHIAAQTRDEAVCERRAA